MTFSDFEDIEGNDHIKLFLKRIIEKECVPHLLLFQGPPEAAKHLFAERFAKMLIQFYDPKSNHPHRSNYLDIHHYRPEGKIAMHTMEAMRQLQQNIYLAPFESAFKVFIIHDAHRMLPYSANALLKTFEEPPSDSVIILLTDEVESLLPTILSRCQRVHFKSSQPKKSKESRPDETMVQAVMSVLAKGRVLNYLEIKQFAQGIEEQLEKERKELEAEARAGTVYLESKNSTAVQKEEIEKEIEGIVSLKFLNKIDLLLHLFASWFRDMQVVQLGGGSEMLLLPDQYEAIEQAVQRGEFYPLDKLEKNLKEAKLAMVRFMPVSSVFETLLLKLIIYT